MSDKRETPRTDWLVEKHQRELNATRAAAGSTVPLLRIAQNQAIESMQHARQLESENEEKDEQIRKLRGDLEAEERGQDNLRRIEVALRTENAELREMLWDCHGVILEMLARGRNSPTAREVAEQARALLAKERK